MRKTNFFKTLLVAVGLCAGVNAWGQATTAFSEDFSDSSADPADYGFAITYGAGSSSALVNFTVIDGVLKCDAGPYASSSAGARTGTATATFTSIGSGNEITISYIWALGSATGNASGSYTKTRLGNSSGNIFELAFFGSDGGKLTLNGTQLFANTSIRNTTYTVTATINMNAKKITALSLICSNNNFNYTSTDYIEFASDITSVDRFAFENSERQNWTNTSSIDDLQISYVEAKEPVSSISVNYKYNEETIYTENINTVGLYCGDSYTVPFRMYVIKDGLLYQTANNSSNPYYGDAVSLTANTIINKNVSPIDLNGGEVVFFKDFDSSDSNNAGIRASYCSAYDNKSFTSEETLPAGIYTFFVRAYSRGRGSSVNIGDTQVFTIADVGNSWQTKTFTDVVVPNEGKLSFVKGSGNSIDPIDVIVAIRHQVSTSITAAGYATYVSDYDLDYTSVEGLTAYKATIASSTITFNKVTTVPAGEGVLLKGAEKSYSVPVTAGVTAWADADNAFVRGTGAAVASEADGKYNYILNNVGGVVGFYKAAGQIVATNRAYIQTPVSASRLSFVFDDDEEEVTGIKTINAVKNGEAIYNLNGQRVNKAKNGLYILNGRKVMFK